jgi:hypothetical protein
MLFCTGQPNPNPEEQLAAADISAIRYRPRDVVGLTVISIFLGVAAAFLQNNDVILTVARRAGVVDWATSDSPYQYLFSNLKTHSMNYLDRRPPSLVLAAKGDAYLQVYMKDTKYGYEGNPGVIAGKLDERPVVLSPACRFTWNDNPRVISSVQGIEGPGVYLSLSDVAAIEMIDAKNSGCAQIFEALDTKAKPP